MEFCGGGSISDCEDILDEPLTEEQIAVVCRECLEVKEDIYMLLLTLPQGLQYLQSCKKIHRDIKAGNLLLTNEGDLKLGKFRYP